MIFYSRKNSFKVDCIEWVLNKQKTNHRVVRGQHIARRRQPTGEIVKLVVHVRELDVGAHREDLNLS